ncbi:MAG TPA: hypothetical protein DDZ84_09820, partial [Firmicutes bacterium]|nr:hypothetical protein [Bacillota bacterium]
RAKRAGVLLATSALEQPVQYAPKSGPHMRRAPVRTAAAIAAELAIAAAVAIIAAPASIAA